MSFWGFLIVLGYLALLHAISVPHSVWVSADREKNFWILCLAIPVINAFMVIVYAVGTFPLLLSHHGACSANPFRRGAAGGYTTRPPGSGTG